MKLETLLCVGIQKIFFRDLILNHIRAVGIWIYILDIHQIILQASSVMEKIENFRNVSKSH